MNIIATILVGALVGWLASLVMDTDAQQGVLMNILIGVVGAVIGAWLFGDVLGFGSAILAGAFSLVGILWAVLGAIVLIGLLKLFKVMR